MVGRDVYTTCTLTTSTPPEKRTARKVKPAFKDVADLTVLTPSLAYGRFIEDNILSVAGQEGVSVQHVIQDGGSVDETVNVLRRYNRAVDWISEPDGGQSDALNKALRKARGRWIAWLNADEFYLPGGLAELVRRGDATSADVVYADVVFVDQIGRVARLLPQHPFSALILRTYGCYIPSSGTIFRRSSLPSDPWDVSLKMMMDWDLYLRLAAQGARFEKVNYPVAAFRRHEMQTTAHATDFADEYAGLFARHGISPESRRWGPWLHGLYKLSSGAYIRQLRARPFSGLGLLWPRDPNDRAIFERLRKTCYPRTTNQAGR
jgi:glycosyltransferase involved in cell wall biosynthesis